MLEFACGRAAVVSIRTQQEEEALQAARAEAEAVLGVWDFLGTLSRKSGMSSELGMLQTL